MAQNPFPSHLDAPQIIKRAFDEMNDRIRVDAVINLSSASIEISDVDDSIKIGDGSGSLFATLTAIGPDVGLDVNVIGGVVSGTFIPTGLMTAVKSQAFTVTDVAAKVPTTALTNRNGISIRVWGAPVVYFGNSSVTVAQGYPKQFREEIIIDITDDIDLWAVCASGETSELRIMEVA